ncbi:unnamed protein product [Fraxinus pennsylvanica]|uniref:Uncharacterized protein n=1 Tax=Fraxinus pennsylvanica TaxID=56036 RepID=A0AAD2E190_9LAMI|nr:unnamed protein product [Fraxinus pennsylvanica]
MLSLNRDNLIWGDFASKVRTFQRGFMGEPKEVRRGRGKFHENSSSRLCEDSVAIPKMDVDLLKHGNGYITTKKDKDITSKTQNMDDDLEWFDLEYDEDPSNEQENDEKNE